MLGVPISGRPGDWAEGVVIVDPSTGLSAGGTSVGGFDSSSRQRVSQFTTLFDGKTLNSDDPLLWDTKGTGTSTWANAGVDLAVTSGQYVIRQGKHPCPYFSGKNQNIKATYDNFQSQSGITKRIGYFNSSPVAPYNTDYDGCWLESTPTSYKLSVANRGVLKLDLDWTAWSNYTLLSGYDWSSFSTFAIDFLWLGGGVADLRLFVGTPNGTVLAHSYKYTGTGAKGPIMESCQHPMRFEIRSTTGSGSLNAICSQVSSEGSLGEVGYSRSIYHPSGVNANTANTAYALKGVRALASRRDLRIAVNSYSGAIVSATTDAGILLLLLNPTLSANLTWVSAGLFDEGTANTGQTVSAMGTVLSSTYLVSSANSENLERNLLSCLPVGIDNVMGQIVLAYIPLTSNQTVSGSRSLLV